MTDLEEAALRDGLVRAWRRIVRAVDDAGREPMSVRLLLATKMQPASRVRTALRLAAELDVPVLLGENRVQELVEKGPALADLAPEWHVIGPLQSNKVNHALRWAHTVESIASLGLAERIARRARDAGRPVDLFVQVNVSGEESKSGVAPESAARLAREVAALEGVRLRGFMTIGANISDELVVRAGFARLRTIRDAVLASGVPGTEDANELSMGMSGDLEAAVAEGATIVRLGTAVFGSRPTV